MKNIPTYIVTNIFSFTDTTYQNVQFLLYKQNRLI